MKILEMGFTPWLKNAFPSDVEFVDTRLRWEEPRTYRPSTRSFFGKMLGLLRQLVIAFRIARHQSYDAVVVRALGPENSGGSPFRLLATRCLGLGLQSLVAFSIRGNRILLAVLDLTDHATIHPRDRWFLRKCDLYFKRELAGNLWGSFESILPRGIGIGAASSLPEFRCLSKKLRPISLGVAEEAERDPDFGEKCHDVFYAASTHGIPVRDEMQNVLDKLSHAGVAVFAPAERISQGEFDLAVRRSWLSISPGGVGWDCYRHYEVAMLGSCPVMNFPLNLPYKPFQHQKSCLYFHQPEELIQLIPEMLKDKSALTQITINAQRHVLRWHIFPQLAEYMHSELASVLSGSASVSPDGHAA